ncbi:unnamed protein product, partial [marine sediment metagenome]
MRARAANSPWMPRRDMAAPDLSYAPPFASAWDAVRIAAQQ